MTILAMDTSGPSLSVALLRGDTFIFQAVQQNGLTHSQCLMPLVDQALRVGDLAPGDVDLFAVTNGPGSFTGVRIGVSTARALAHATGKPCAGVNALRALAMGAEPFAGVVCALQDARAGQVYAAAYRDGVQVLADEAVRLDDLLARLDAQAQCCFTGDGAVRHRDAITQAMGARASFAPPDRMALHAANVALYARRHTHAWAGWQALTPYYLRAPQAERERLQREAARDANA